jgi:hypothetical protein
MEIYNELYETIEDLKLIKLQTTLPEKSIDRILQI